MQLCNALLDRCLATPHRQLIRCRVQLSNKQLHKILQVLSVGLASCDATPASSRCRGQHQKPIMNALLDRCLATPHRHLIRCRVQLSNKQLHKILQVVSVGLASCDATPASSRCRGQHQKPIMNALLDRCLATPHRHLIRCRAQLSNKQLHKILQVLSVGLASCDATPASSRCRGQHQKPIMNALLDRCLATPHRHLIRCRVQLSNKQLHKILQGVSVGLASCDATPASSRCRGQHQKPIMNALLDRCLATPHRHLIRCRVQLSNKQLHKILQGVSVGLASCDATPASSRCRGQHQTKPDTWQENL